MVKLQKKPPPIAYSLPPQGMKVKKLPRKPIRFNRLFSPSDILGYDERIEPGEYVSTVTRVTTDHRSDGSWIRVISYDFKGPSRPRFCVNRYVYFNPDGTTDKASSDFIDYLTINGAIGPSWQRYVGCQEVVTFDRDSLFKYRRCVKYAGTPCGLIEVDRRFIYEPKGGVRNASSR